VDDDLTQRLAAAATDVSHAVRIGSPSAVRTRGDRRRVRTAATSAAAVGALTTLGVVGAGSLGPPTAGQGGGKPGVITHIPAALRMPHEGSAGWQRNDNPEIASAFARCNGFIDPTLRARTDARTMTGPGRPGEEEHSPTRLTEQLFLYQNEAVARSVIAELRAAVTQCGWIDPGMGQQLSGTKVDSQYPNLHMRRVEGIQQGNTVFLIHAVIGGAGMTSSGGDDLWAMAEELCRTMRACNPAASPGAPMSPQPSGSPGKPLPPGPTPPRR
jgi:hypothetical protein